MEKGGGGERGRSRKGEVEKGGGGERRWRKGEMEKGGGGERERVITFSTRQKGGS